jgi:hypothetical protein
MASVAPGDAQNGSSDPQEFSRAVSTSASWCPDGLRPPEETETAGPSSMQATPTDLFKTSIQGARSSLFQWIFRVTPLSSLPTHARSGSTCFCAKIHLAEQHFESYSTSGLAYCLRVPNTCCQHAKVGISSHPLIARRRRCGACLAR